MSLHPAAKVARALLKKQGVASNYHGTLTLRVSGDLDLRPMFVDIRLSAHEDKAKLDVCHLYSEHTEYARLKPLHGLVFDY